MQAVILCGGKGERLKPLTNSVPKPLVKINDQPIIIHIMNHLIKHQIKDIILTTGHKSDQFINFFKDHELDCRIKIIDSGDADIIARIQSVKEHINGNFLVLYGDTISNIDITKLINFHKKHTNEATMSVWPLETQFGLVEIDECNKITGFKEKPKLDKWVNIGYFCYEKTILDYVDDYSKHEDFLAGMASKNILSAYKHEGLHLTINTIQELEEAEKKIDEIY
jgi:glucose-1-phosphate cytidylyltransferase